MTRSLFCLFAIALTTPAIAADWPCLLGPTRDGQSTEVGLNWEWPKEGPPITWKMEIGSGLAGVSVAGGSVFVFHRVEKDDVLQAVDAATGKELWKFSYPSKFIDDYRVGDGPRCTPLVSKGTVFAYAADGQLHAVDAKSGKLLWAKNLSKEYEPPQGYFGVGAGPAIIAGNLLVNVGAKGASIVAFDPATGKEVWKIADDAASYSAITEATLDDKTYAVAFTRAGLLVLDAKSGEVRYTKAWRSRLDASVNAATPIVRKDEVFLTASYGTGATLLKLKGNEPDEIWANDKSMSSQFNTPVRVGDHLYGIDGRQEGKSARLRCVEWATGKVMWSKEKFGCAHVIAVDGGLLAVSEDGELTRYDASPKAFVEKAKATVVDGVVRAAPALADGRLYLRNESKLICVKLK